MKRALVLNAGLAWGAYQIGALRHLVRDRDLHFDLCAGSGIGAMNAALVACGQFEALEAFWNRIGLKRLLAPNLRSGWLGLATGAPQREFIAEHVSETSLAARGTRLTVNVFNLQTGQEQLLDYPGCSLPLVDAIMAAVATPGLCPPIVHEGQQLAEGTFIRGFFLEAIAERDYEEIYAVAACLPDEPASLRRYVNWRQALERSIEMNQAHDVRDGRKAASDLARAAEAFRRVSALPERLGAMVGDPELRAELVARIAAVYARSRFPLRRARGPKLHLILPSQRLDYAPWSFREKRLADARALGYDDAVRTLEGGQPVKLGLFLTPGAARTAYQVGAVHALMSECKLRFDVIAASSVGALNGVFAAMGEIDDLARTWAGWRSRDVLEVDWGALRSGAFFWAPNLMKYDYYRELITEDRVRADKLLPGTRFRFNLANLTTGEQSFFEWPGSEVPLVEAVRASVAVPSLIEPKEIDGAQWVDGLVVDGFPIEPLLLETGVDRAFVVGVAPRQTDTRLRGNLFEVLMRAIDWNQESETTLGLARARRVNEYIARFQDDRRELERTLSELAPDPELRAKLLAEVARTYAEADFPYTRKVVELVPVLPKHDIEIMYAHYDPRITLELLEQGRKDALAAVHALRNHAREHDAREHAPAERAREGSA